MASRIPPYRLGDWIAGQRWFASKRRRIVAVEAQDCVPLGTGRLWVVGVRLDDGGLDRYAVPLLEGSGLRVEQGVFGAMMDVRLVNWGPVTLLLDSRKQF